MNSGYLGIYWGAREESVDRCADRLQRFTEKLALCDDSLAAWWERPSAPHDEVAQPARTADTEYLVHALLEGRKRTDVNRRVIENLGFDLWWTNRPRGIPAIVLHVGCGGYSRHVGNAVTLDFSARSGGLPTKDLLRRVLLAAADIWEPDWGIVQSDAAARKRQPQDPAPLVDWMVYVCNGWLPRPPELKPPASLERLEHGTLIVVQPDLPDPDNMEDIQQVARVGQALHARLSLDETN